MIRRLSVLSLLSLTVICVPRAEAVASTCYQTGLKPGCVYYVSYNNGSSDTQIADSSGRVKRPCNLIIIGIDSDMSGCLEKVSPVVYEC